MPAIGDSPKFASPSLRGGRPSTRNIVEDLAQNQTDIEIRHLFPRSVFNLDVVQEVGKEESGKSPQSSVVLRDRSGRTLHTRIKQIKTINEARSHYRISRNPAFEDHVPRFFGVFDKEGRAIDIESSDPVPADRFPLNLMMEDIVKKAIGEGHSSEAPKDFKFGKPRLLGNSIEVIKHNQTKHGKFYKLVRRIFFAASRCSFGYQKSTTSHNAGLLKRIRHVFARFSGILRTKRELRKQFSQLGLSALSRAIDDLEQIKTAISRSSYVFSDASLLFVPFKKGGKNRLKIYLIDFAHGIAKKEFDAENKIEFKIMRKDLIASLDELIKMAESIMGS